MRMSTTLYEGARYSHYYLRPRAGVCKVRSQNLRQDRIPHTHVHQCEITLKIVTILTERMYPHATYTLQPDRKGGSKLIVSPSRDVPPIRWSSVAHPDREGSLPSGAHPLTITVNAGESMYLPAGWWHHVKQEGGVTIALNWWYDIEPRGTSWVWLNLLRGPEHVLPENVDHEE
jgi:hypothetical protein